MWPIDATEAYDETPGYSVPLPPVRLWVLQKVCEHVRRCQQKPLGRLWIFSCALPKWLPKGEHPLKSPHGAPQEWVQGKEGWEAATGGEFTAWQPPQEATAPAGVPWKDQQDKGAWGKCQELQQELREKDRKISEMEKEQEELRNWLKIVKTPMGCTWDWFKSPEPMGHPLEHFKSLQLTLSCCDECVQCIVLLMGLF